MRFLLNFIFFGILFFVIWQFFPEAFAKLVEWAQIIFDYLSNFFKNLWERISPWFQKSPLPNEPKGLVVAYLLTFL